MGKPYIFKICMPERVQKIQIWLGPGKDRAHGSPSSWEKIQMRMKYTNITARRAYQVRDGAEVVR